MKEFQYVLTDREGIHARPAGLLVKKANEFQSEIKIERSGKSADAKRIFAVMGLGAKCGEQIAVTAEGADEEAAAAAMEAFLKENL